MDSEGPATFQDTQNATSSTHPSTRTLYLTAEEPKIYRQRRVSRDRFHMGTFKGFPSLVGTEEGKRVAQSPPPPHTHMDNRNVMERRAPLT